MPPLEAGVVQGADGLHGTIVAAPAQLSGDTSQVIVQLADGRQFLVPVHMLHPQQDGTYYVPLNLADLASAPRGDDLQVGESLIIPVLVEEIQSRKQRLETGTVTLTKHVHEREELVDEPLFRDEVEVTRVPVQRIVDAPVPVREENGTTIIPVLEEVLVVEKRLMLTEEIHIRTHRVETRQPQRVTLRSEDVTVERLKHSQAPDA
ncbi:MAG: YsnF/AvaK domain-containing protein [Candidatus Tectimicrobiota bacterium]